MRLRQLIRESNASSILSKYFEKDAYTHIEETPDGVNVEGDLLVKESTAMPELPIKLNHVNGTVDLQGCGLTSLKNAPRSCSRLSVGQNPSLTSLATDEPITISDELYAENIGITDLSGLKILECKELSLNDCKHLISLNGLGNVELKLLSIKGCILFADDLTQYKIEKVEINLNQTQKMPIVELITSGSPKIASLGNDADPFVKIIKKYIDKGPNVMIDLIRELRDQGFKEAARIT